MQTYPVQKATWRWTCGGLAPSTGCVVFLSLGRLRHLLASSAKWWVCLKQPEKRLLQPVYRCVISTKSTATQPNLSILPSPKNQTPTQRNLNGLQRPRRLLVARTHSWSLSTALRRWQTPSTRTSTRCLKKRRLALETAGLCTMRLKKLKVFLRKMASSLLLQIYRLRCGTMKNGYTQS